MSNLKNQPKNAAAGCSEPSLSESTGTKPSPAILWFCSVCRFPVLLYIDSLLFYSSASTCSKAGAHLCIHACEHARVHIFPRRGYIKPAKEQIWPALSDSSNTLFLFNTKIWAVLLLLLSHTNVIISLITWMLLTSMILLPQSVLFQEV